MFFQFGSVKKHDRTSTYRIAFAFEIAVKAAARETRRRHDLVDGRVFESIPVEKFSRRLDDLHSDLVAVADWVGHDRPSSKPALILANAE